MTATIRPTPTATLECSIAALGHDYEVRFSLQGVAVNVFSPRQTRTDGLKAEVLVETLREDGTRGYLCREIITINSGRAWVGLAGRLQQIYPLQSTSWDFLLTQASECVIRAFRQGAPMIEIGDMVAPKREMQINGVLVQHHPNLVVADAESAKSLTATILGIHVNDGLSFLGRAVQQDPVAVLDWELDESEQNKRTQEYAAGLGLAYRPKLYYRYCSTPLADDVQAIKRMLDERGVRFVIIDSVGLACGGDLNGAEDALRFFAALRSLNVGALLVHHNNKDRQAKSSYGSVYFRNLSRVVWECRAQHFDSGELGVDYFNTKASFGPRLRAFSLRYRFEPGRILLETAEAGSAAAPEVPMVDVIAAAIERLGGASTVAEIAEYLHKRPDNIRAQLNRHDGRFVHEGDGWKVKGA